MTNRSAHDIAIGRCRAINRWLDAHPAAAQLPVLIAVIGIAIVVWRGEHQADTSSDRDQARLYQRCEQNRPTAIATNYLIARLPELRELVQQGAPGALDSTGQQPVPDCAGTYPRGAQESHRFPDAVLTTRTPTPNPRFP